MTNKEICTALKSIIEEVTGIKDIAKISRQRELVIARAVFYYLSVKYFDITLEYTGNFLKRNHCACINAFKKIEADYVYSGFNKIFKKTLGIFEQRYGSVGLEPVKIGYEDDEFKAEKFKEENRHLRLEIVKMNERFKAVDNPIIDLLKKLPPEKIEEFINYRLKPFLIVNKCIANERFTSTQVQ